MNQKERNSNFELMRIVSMLFIILWHIYMFGGIRNNPRIMNPTIKVFFEIVLFIIIVHVNSFVLISGYHQYKSKFNLKKLFSLIDISLFYRVVIVLVLLLLGLITIGKIEALRYFSPLLLTENGEYWYLRVFILLYIFSPFINLLIQKLNKKNHFQLLVLLFIFFSFLPFVSGNRINENYGYTLSNFIFLYLIGSYISKYKIKEKILNRISNNLYRLLLFIIFILSAIFNFCLYKTTGQFFLTGKIIGELSRNINSMHIAYSNPLVIIQTVSYFLFFESFNFKSKIINKISSLTLGIYLIHNNTYLKLFLYKWLKIENGNVYSYKFILYVFIMIFVIFILCAIIEFLRQIIIGFIKKRKITKLFQEKIYSFINSFKIKESNIKE